MAESEAPTEVNHKNLKRALRGKRGSEEGGGVGDTHNMKEDVTEVEEAGGRGQK